MIKNKALLPILIIFFVTCLIFAKVFTKGLFPVPGDLLVSFYFPWYSGGWEGYDPWTTRKELLGADAVRQIYLWREFAAEQFKEGNIPLWNPYTFSGQPLLANFQSSVFYPLNSFYLLTDPRNAWILLIMIQPLLGGVFMYLAARSFKLDPIPSAFAAVAFMFSSYLITWMESGNIAHSYIWLPFSFWAINNYFEKQKFRHLLLLTISLSMSILAGHPQTAIYIYMATGIFWLYKMWDQKAKLTKIALLLFALSSSLLISAIQLLPTYQLYKISPVSLPFSKEVFDRSILPYENLITFFASDFFGHPAAGNFWNESYGDFTPYFGVIPAVFALWAIYALWRMRLVKFAALAAGLFILAAVNSPLTYLIRTLQIPILDSTTPSRFIAISIFFLVTLAAFGLQDFAKNIKDKKYFKKFMYFTSFIGIIYFLMWIFALFAAKLGISVISETSLAVTRRNLILPTFMFLTVPLGAIFVTIAPYFFKRLSMSGSLRKESLTRAMLIIGLFAATIIGGVYYTNKFLPVAPKKFIFPDHLLFDWLKGNAGLNRFYGGGTAHIDFNFPTHYQVYGAEGYDTLRIERYAQLLASSYTGAVPVSYLRSDGVFPSEENRYRRRLFDLLGVKYLLDKEDNPKSGADWHYERFPNDQVEGFWQDGKFQVYIRPSSLPRIFTTTKYEVADDNQIIKKIYDTDFNLQTILLEKEPSIPIIDTNQSQPAPNVLKYSPAEVVIETDLDGNALLFLSDTHDPDWQVKIDGEKAELLRAHYALRAVAVPSGKHLTSFKYQPKSFTTGLYITSASLIGLFLTSIYMIKMKKF